MKAIDPKELIGATIVGIQRANGGLPTSFQYDYLVVELPDGETVKLDPMAFSEGAWIEVDKSYGVNTTVPPQYGHS